MSVSLINILINDYTVLLGNVEIRSKAISIAIIIDLQVWLEGGENRVAD